MGRPFGRFARAIFRTPATPAAHDRFGIAMIREKKISFTAGRELGAQPLSSREGPLTVGCVSIENQNVSGLGALDSEMAPRPESIVKPIESIVQCVVQESRSRREMKARHPVAPGAARDRLDLVEL